MTSTGSLAPVAAPAVAGLQGLLMMAGLIVAIGAQNALVLRQGLSGRHVLPVVALCIASDALLVTAGVLGLGALIGAQPLMLEVFRWGGVAWLVMFGAAAARRAWRGGGSLPSASVGTGLRSALAATLAMTYLNPHVYLDTVVLVGGVGAQHEGPARTAFAAGASLASALWFSALGFGAARAARFLRQPAAWRAIDASVAVLMWATAAQSLWLPLRSS